MISNIAKIQTLILFLILAGNINAIQIKGSRLFSHDDLARKIDSNMPDDSMLSRINMLYRDAGYLNAKVSIDSANHRGEKEIIITEGKPTLIDSIFLESIPAINDLNFDDLIREFSNQVASTSNLNSFADECVALLAENGRPFASGQWLGFRLNSYGNISAVFRIAPGPYSRIGRIQYRGIKRTQAYTLDRALRLKIGEPFSETRAKDAEQYLENLPYIDVASAFEIEPIADGDSCAVIFNLKELPSTRFDGAVGLSSTKGKSVFVGKLNLEFGDILGTGRAFGLLWNRKDRLSNELRLNYLEPFIFESPLDLHLEAFQVDKDSSFIETGGAAGLSHEFGGGLNCALWLTIGRTVPETGSKLTSSTSRSVRADFGYTEIDRRENPMSGYDIMTNINYRYRSNQIPSDTSIVLPTKLTSVGMDTRFYLKASRRFVAAFRLAAWGIVSNDGQAPLDELRFLGGFESLRGYSERRFPAFRYATLSLESRIITGRYSRAYLFTDLANIKSSQDSRYLFWPGYGIGIVAPSALGQFKLEIGWGKTGFPSNAFFNFGLAGGF